MDNSVSEIKTWEEPKLPIDVARGLLSIFLGLSGLSLTFTKLINEKSIHNIELYSFAIICLFLSARIFDWMLDSINSASWAKLTNQDHDKTFINEFNKWDGFIFRAKIYDHTYFVFSIIISALSYVSCFYLLDNVESVFSKTLSIHSYVIIAKVFSILIPVFILYQMMTIKSKYSKHMLYIILLVFGVAGFTAALIN